MVASWCVQQWLGALMIGRPMCAGAKISASSTPTPAHSDAYTAKPRTPHNRNGTTIQPMWWIARHATLIVYLRDRGDRHMWTIDDRRMPMHISVDIGQNNQRWK